MFSSKSGILFVCFFVHWVSICLSSLEFKRYSFSFLIFELAAECQFPVIIQMTEFHVQAVGSCRLVKF